MQIREQIFYPNKTWRYLVPTLHVYGETFLDLFHGVPKLAVGIYDMKSEVHDKNENLIYILADTMSVSGAYEKFITFLEGKEYFKGVYTASKDNLYKKMIVVKVPKEYFETYHHFLAGNYSKMYSPETLALLFKDEYRKDEFNILNRKESALIAFVREVNSLFSTKDVRTNDLRDGEWELPLVIKEEIFNAKSVGTIYFDIETHKIW